MNKSNRSKHEIFSDILRAVETDRAGLVQAYRALFSIGTPDPYWILLVLSLNALITATELINF